MKKLLPYVLGVTVLLVGALVSSRVLPKQAPTSSSPKPTSATAQLQPVRVEKPPEVLYLLVAQALVEKLKTGDLLLTVREHRELTRQTSRHLRDDLGLELPRGFSLPHGIPRSWLEHPEFGAPDAYAFIQQVQAANRDYLQKIVGRLQDAAAHTASPEAGWSSPKAGTRTMTPAASRFRRPTGITGKRVAAEGWMKT